MPSKLTYLTLVFSLLFYGCASAAEVKPPEQPQAEQQAHQQAQPPEQPQAEPQAQTGQEEQPLSPEEEKKREAQKNFFAGLMAQNHGNPENAVKYFEAALELDPGNYNTRIYLARVYEKMKKSVLALGEYKKAKELDPKDPRAYNGLIGAYINLELYKEAVKLDKEAEKNGVNPLDVAGSLGWVYYNLGDFKNARRHFELLKSSTADTTVINNLGLVSFSEGKFGEALEYFREADEKNPGSILAPYFIALTEMKLGNEGEALDALKEGLRKDPQLEDKTLLYKLQYFPRVDTGDLSPLFARIKAEQGQEKEKTGEGQPQEEKTTPETPSQEAK